MKSKMIEVWTCRGCPFLGHNGAYQTGGPRPVCRKVDAKISKLPLSKWGGEIPGWCPLPNKPQTGDYTPPSVEELKELEKSMARCR